MTCGSFGAMPLAASRLGCVFIVEDHLSGLCAHKVVFTQGCALRTEYQDEILPASTMMFWAGLTIVLVPTSNPFNF